MTAIEVGIQEKGMWKIKSCGCEIADGRLSKHIFLFEQIEEEEPL